MLFWIFLVITVVCIAVSIKTWDWDHEFVPIISMFLGVFGGFAVFVLGIFLIANHIEVDGKIAGMREEYTSLVYQYENDIYENDNDLGKRELMNDIQSWNENLAYNQALQNDFWVGIFIPDIYDQFEFIELEKGD